MNKWAFLERDNHVLSCLLSDDRLLECRISKKEPAFIDTILIARVEKILPSIQAAFLTAGETHFYLPLKKENIIYSKQARAGKLTVGDELVVQVEREAIKTKEAALRTNLQLSGRFLVLLYGENRILFSKKLTDKNRRTSLEQLAKDILGQSTLQCGILFRTNAADAEDTFIQCEIEMLLNQLNEIVQKAPFRNFGSVLWQPKSDYLRVLQDISNVDEVVTDSEKLYQTCKSELSAYPETQAISCRFYEDKLLSLDKCLRISHQISKAMDKQVWLSSGAYLVIEQTEALTAIDVNTGKAQSKKANMEDFLLKVNLEAAKEIMAQIRLRNLSGIIILDFINMKEKSHQETLLDRLRNLASHDKIYTSVIDITALGLVELTRKKETDTLAKQYRDAFGEA